ncbi:MAG: ABC transporter ATP-binding protein [Planctomycetota bacterium]|nr:ABC transporter ATP-binding protein [Planctomycetota bacterium]
MAAVILENVTKRFGTTIAVDNVSLAVADRELLVLLGPSGCGKSTTLRMIAGLEEISEGTISIAGQQVNQLAPRDRDIAMVFQNYALYPHMTVQQNMAFPLRMRRVASREIQQRVHEASEILGIAELLDRTPSQLSGGQQQRVALGRAMVRDPAVFLLDEPLSNLDMQLRSTMRQEILELHERLQVTMIHVTHDQVEAMTLGDRIAIMHEGQLQQLGTPGDVYDQPANRFVAGFLGNPPMNFLSINSQLITQLSRFGDLPEETELGFRPEQVTTGQSGDLKLSCQVISIQQLGAESLVTLRSGEQQFIMRSVERQLPDTDSSLVVSLPADDIHCFSSLTGKRLGMLSKLSDNQPSKS